MGVIWGGYALLGKEVEALTISTPSLSKGHTQQLVVAAETEIPAVASRLQCLLLWTALPVLPAVGA